MRECVRKERGKCDGGDSEGVRVIEGVEGGTKRWRERVMKKEENGRDNEDVNE